MGNRLSTTEKDLNALEKEMRLEKSQLNVIGRNGELNLILRKFM